MRRIGALVLAATLVVAACGDDDGDDIGGSTGDVDFAVDAAPTETASADSDAQARDGASGDGGEVATGEESAAPDATEAPADSGFDDSASIEGRSVTVAPGEPAAVAAPEVTPVALQPIDLGRDIIFTGDKVVAVDDVVAAATQAQQLMAEFEALVFGQQSLTEPEPRTTITFKVLPSDFNAALATLSELGEVVSQTVSAEDVTDRVGDLESRITTAEISVGRLQGFLADATDLNQIAQLEAELLRRETDLEVLRGQLRTLQTAVALATINLTLIEVTGPLPTSGFRTDQTVYEGHDEGAGCETAESDEVEVGDGDDVTVCLFITNVGDSQLGELQVADEELGITLPDFIVVDGDTTVPIEPNGALVLAYEHEADEDIRTETDVAVVPMTDGDISIGELASRRSSTLVSIDDAAPGFGDVLGDSAGVLATIGRAVVLVVAAIVPFAWLLVIAAAWWWFRGRRRSGIDEESDA